MTEPQIFETPDQLGLAVARAIESRIAAKPGQRFLLGCPGGRSPRPVYAALAQLAVDKKRDLSPLIIVMMDDYVVERAEGFDHVDGKSHFSCRKFARDEIVAVLNAGLPAGHRTADSNIWFPDPHAPQAYDQRIADAGGIDYFLLASGASDGHVAFNPAGTSVESRTRVVRLSSETRRDNMQTFPDFTTLDEVPLFGVTVGIRTIIEQSRAVGMVVWGSGKREAFRRLAKATSYDPDWPASVFAACAEATLYADRAATDDTAS